MKTTKVFLRAKDITKNRKSLYLDYYPALLDKKSGKKTRREFLKMYVFDKPKNPIDRQHNKEVKALAENIRAQRQIDIQKGTFGFISETKLKTDFIEFVNQIKKEKYNSIGNYGNWSAALIKIKKFRPNGILMEDLDENLLRDFQSFLYKDITIKQNTKVSYYRKLAAAIKQAFKEDYIISNPVKNVKGMEEEETKREFLSLEEIKILAKTDCKDTLLKKAFLFSALTGMRFSDIKNLKWSDLHSGPDGHYVRFKQKKTKGEETLPIPNSAYKLIDQNQSDIIFDGLKYASYHSYQLEKWITASGINKHITFHNARHSFATLQLTMGTDIYTVSKLLGHKELKTTQIYAKVVDQKKNEAINKLNDIEL